MVRLRAFGNFSIRVSDAATFVKQIAGTGGRFTLDELDNQLRDMVSSRFADALGASKIPALDLAGNYDQIGQMIVSRIATDFQPFGMTLVSPVGRGACLRDLSRRRPADLPDRGLEGGVLAVGQPDVRGGDVVLQVRDR